MTGLPTQLWARPTFATGRLCEAAMQPIVNRVRPWSKPYEGGLWTSTFDERAGSAWTRWCLAEEFCIDSSDPSWPNCWLLHPRADARIYTVDSYSALELLCASYGRSARGGTTYPDWLAVAEDYDAVHLTGGGQVVTHLSVPLNLWGWDCESTLWFRWAFESAEYIGRQTFADATAVAA